MGTAPSKCLCAPDPWLAPDSTKQEVLANAMTGDIVTSSGRHEGKLIAATSLTGWTSHVFVVIRNPDDPKRPMLTEEYPTVVGRELRPGLPSYHTGAQLVDMKERLDTYGSGKLAWRPLYVVEEAHLTRQGQSDTVRRLTLDEERVLYRTYMRRLGLAMPEYDMSLKDFWEFGTRNDPITDDNDGKYVCTSWATTVLSTQHGMGVFAENLIDADGEITAVVPGNITLGDYAGLGTLPLKSKYAYGDLHFFKGAQLPVTYPDPQPRFTTSGIVGHAGGVVVMGASTPRDPSAPRVSRD